MIQKLYSPVFCKIYAEEDYQYDTPEKLSQRGAADYIDKIKLLAYKENETLGRERGLMEYYGEDDSVDKKVKSLFINFELINRELWGVTTIDVTERLNQQEMELLKDYISGQMSDGFGEGFEQREIKTEDGDLYVSLWDSGDEFHIYTAQEFSDRLGIELSEIIADLRDQLMKRIDKNIDDFDIADESDVIDKKDLGAAMESAYYVMSTYKSYTSDQLKCLLEFANPLEIVAERVKGTTPTIYDFAPVLDLIYTNREWYKANYATADAIPAIPEKSGETAALRSQLIERSEKNWDDYRHSPHNTTPDTLFNTSVEVINRRNAYVFMKDYQDFTTEQLKCLLQFANPVEVVGDYLDPMSDGSELPSILSSILEKQEYYKGHYALADAPVAVDDRLADLRSRLIERVETEYKQYHNGLFDLNKTELIEKSDYTDAVDTSYRYLTGYKNYTSEDLEFLLNMSIPLETVAEQVYEMFEENVGFPVILEFLKDNYESPQKSKVAAETVKKSDDGQSKAEKFFTGVAQGWDEYVQNNPIVKEKPEQSAPDKELKGMAKLRKAEKEKAYKSEKPERKRDKSKRKQTHRKFGRDN